MARFFCAQARQNKGRGWEEEAAALAERERQLQAELSAGQPRATPAPVGAHAGPAIQRPLLDIEAELRRVQRCGELFDDLMMRNISVLSTVSRVAPWISLLHERLGYYRCALDAPTSAAV